MYYIGIFDISININKWNKENIIEFSSSNKDGLNVLESWRSGIAFPIIMKILIEIDDYIDNIISFMAILSVGNISYKNTTINKHYHIYRRFTEKI